MTAEWSPHYWEELACNFTTHFLSMPLNNKCRASLCGQLRGRRTRVGLPQQEGNLRGQIKSGVGCLLHGWMPLLAPWKAGRKKNSSRLAFYEAKEPVPELLARACIHWLTFWPAAAQQEFARVNGIFTDWPCQSDSCYFWKMEDPLRCSDSARHCRTSSSRKYQIKGFWHTTKCNLRFCD